MRNGKEHLVWFDSMQCGLVPCRIESVGQDSSGPIVHMRVTATRGAYKRGMPVMARPHRVAVRKLTNCRMEPMGLDTARAMMKGGM